ncbi:inositol monophosphatase family protein [Sporolactobacillus terrae]|uniref:Inositol monophosphatase n=1 Tax=Sporolactobacillus terrae TaxID=269673 RepID=A0ABX5Q6G4_9BACL|nr:inositol monophosphatase family protein [Sporolactobacillus terrae]QAA22231.1 inositol monophosphatase [Sporolactobacillus terrae]QAA25205.1 inositol monophosphatase [Sporolactobacillus terrae]
MTEHDWDALERQVIQWIKEAGTQLRASLLTPLEVSEKSAHNDLVTNMDRHIEKFLIEKIRAAYPGDRIVSEEGFGDGVADTDGVLWLLDPIDGTLNFVMQKRFFAVSIGVYEEGEGRAAFIYDVMADELFHCISGQGAYQNTKRLATLTSVTIENSLIDLSATWLKPNRMIHEETMTEIVKRCSGTRAYGAASLELAYVAAGYLDAYFTMRLSPWDYGAGLILLREVGGSYSRADGQPLNILSKTSVLAARPGLHHFIAEHVRKQIQSGKFICEPDGGHNH